MSKVVYISEKKTMAQAKLMWLIADYLGIPLAFWGFIINLDNVKSAVIALLAIIYLMLRIYYYAVQKKQAVRKEELEIWQREQDKVDRQNKHKS